MTKEEKIELLRRRLAQQTDLESLADAMAMEVVIICREFGWPIEYVLNMEVWKFKQIAKQLAKIYKEMSKEIDAKKQLIGV